MQHLNQTAKEMYQQNISKAIKNHQNYVSKGSNSEGSEGTPNKGFHTARDFRPYLSQIGFTMNSTSVKDFVLL